MQIISSFTLPVMILGIIIFGLYKKTNVYDSFVSGAKTGVESTLQIIPPLVGLMVGISVLRGSGALDMLGKLLEPVTSFIHMPPEILPLALLRPISGSGSTAIVTDLFKNFGPDSQIGKIASVMMGSTETTFYTIAVYFGAVGVKRLRHTVKSALLGDLTGILLALFTALIFLC